MPTNAKPNFSNPFASAWILLYLSNGHIHDMFRQGCRNLTLIQTGLQEPQTNRSRITESKPTARTEKLPCDEISR